MSFLPSGEKGKEDTETDTDARSRQIDDAQSVLNSTTLLKSLKDVKVQNVCGSTAGAGSGTFHKYRQANRREQFRLDKLKREHKISEINERMKKRKRENDEILEQKRSKKRKIRERKKQRKLRATQLSKQTDDSEHIKEKSDRGLKQVSNNDNEKEVENEDIDLQKNNNLESTEDKKDDSNGETNTKQVSNQQNKQRNEESILAALAAEFGD